MPSNSDREKAPLGLTLSAIGTLLFLHVPLLIIFLYAFTTDEATYSFPLPGLTTKWFGVALHRSDLWAALTLSVRVAVISTLASLILGTLAAAAVYRSNFFGKEAVSFLLVLPIALPGIVTGVVLALARIAGETAPLLFTSLNNRFFTTRLDQPISSLTVQVYTYASSPYEDWHRQAWAGALVLVSIVLICSLLARLATRRLERMHARG